MASSNAPTAGSLDAVKAAAKHIFLFPARFFAAKPRHGEDGCIYCGDPCPDGEEVCSHACELIEKLP